MTTTFDATFQNKVIALALRDNPFMQRVEGLIDPAYFDFETHAYLIDLVNRHFATYRETPDATIVMREIKAAKTAKTLKDEFVDDLKGVLKAVYSPAADLSNRDHTVDEVSKFARQRAMEAALTKSIDILDSGGDFDVIEKAIREAQSVGAQEGAGKMSLFNSVSDRVTARLAKLKGGVVRGITTGHKELDDLLYHKGWGRKEMALLMGGAKAGKSTGLQHFAINAADAGHKVLYVTCENSAEVTGDRMDAAVSGVPMKDLDVSGPTIEAAYRAMAAKGGCIEVHEFPMNTCRVSDIRRIIRKYQAQGVQFDLLVVDYADIMQPEGRHSEARHALNEIYAGLRALATEENLAVLTATQTNRSGHKATTATATDAAEDFNKVRIADVLISINATDEERKLNQLRLYLAAMRNSEGGLTLHCMCDRSRMKFISRVVKVV